MKFGLFLSLVLSIISGCQTSHSADPGAELASFRGHKELQNWIEYRDHLRRSTPKDIRKEHDLVKSLVSESSDDENKLKLALILLTIHYPRSDIAQGRKILQTLAQNPERSPDFNAIVLLFSDFSKDVQNLSLRNHSLKRKLKIAKKNKDQLQTKIDELTKIEKSLVKKKKP